MEGLLSKGLPRLVQSVTMLFVEQALAKPVVLLTIQFLIPVYDIYIELIWGSGKQLMIDIILNYVK